MACAVNTYFDDCEANGKFPTIAGLCVAIGFCDRFALYEYEKRAAAKDEFSRIIRYARTRIEDIKEGKMCAGEGSTAGLIFSLKNHHKYIDKTEVNQTVATKTHEEMLKELE